MKYRKKPIIVEAVQWDGSDESFDAISKLIGDYTTWSVDYQVRKPVIKVPTHVGICHAKIGSWIYTNVRGKIQICNNDTFTKLYEPVEE